MIEVTQEESFPPGNPFLYDGYRMGTRLGANVIAMYEKFDNDVQPYIIICNTDTGERIRLRFV